MKKRKLGHMHWFFALLLWLVAHLVAYLLLPSVISLFPGSSLLPAASPLAFILAIVLLRARDFVWYIFTFRRYCEELTYFVICGIGVLECALIAFLDSDRTLLPKAVYILCCVIDVGTSALMYVHFINRPGKEAALEAAKESAASDA